MELLTPFKRLIFLFIDSYVFNDTELHQYLMYSTKCDCTKCYSKPLQLTTMSSENREISVSSNLSQNHPLTDLPKVVSDDYYPPNDLRKQNYITTCHGNPQKGGFWFAYQPFQSVVEELQQCFGNMNHLTIVIRGL